MNDFDRDILEWNRGGGCLLVAGSSITFLTDRSMESFGRGLGHEERAYIFGKVRQFMVKSLP